MSKNIVGQIQIYSDSNMPKDWLRCDGSEVSVIQYPALFACIGAQHGGDGVSRFAVPDFAHSHNLVICADGYFPLEGTHPDEQLPKVEEIRDYIELRVKAFQEAYRNGIPPIKPHLHKNFDPIKDDLTKIEGIGPKIRDVLLNGGITSFAQLAQISADALEPILHNGGVRMIPDSYAKQAELAAAGHWDELQQLQSELFGGRPSI